MATDLSRAAAQPKARPAQCMRSRPAASCAAGAGAADICMYRLGIPTGLGKCAPQYCCASDVECLCRYVCYW